MPGRAWRSEPRVLDERPTAAIGNVGKWLAAAWADDDPRTRHSRFVALLRRLLPALGIGLLLLIAVWPRLAPLWERIRLGFPAIDLRDARELDMIKPRYTGTDHDGRPYIVTAVSARQLPDRQDLISLKSPRADMKSHSGANIVITARTGIYQSQTQLLDLFEDVTVVHQNGTTFVTQSARVDATNNTAEGNKPVEGHGPSGDVQAEGFRLLDRGDKILFTGKSDLLLRNVKSASPPDAAKTAAVPSPSRPSAVLAAAHPRPTRANSASPHRASAERTRPHPVSEHVHRPVHPNAATAKRT